MNRAAVDPNDRRLYSRVEEALSKLDLAKGCELSIEARQGSSTSVLGSRP
jgi:hypothetical protein